MLKAKAQQNFVDEDQIFREAVALAIEENERVGIPSPFTKNGKILYKLPDGTITDERPAFFDKSMEEIKR